MRVFYFLIICVFLFSCDKNKELIRYSEYYHIDGNDTISAIYIPNSFTPDGDRINDVFNIYFINGSNENNIEIFNGHGILMFNATYLNWNVWDGIYKSTKAKNGKYTYKLAAKDFTGYVYNIEGTVYLVR